MKEVRNVGGVVVVVVVLMWRVKERGNGGSGGRENGRVGS